MKKKSCILKLIVIFQIFLMINLAPSNSYLINKLFTINQIGIVNAEEEELAMYCCAPTCQNTLSTDTESCEVDLTETSCENVMGCEPICCINPGGDCDANTPRKFCENRGGTVSLSKNCEIDQCKEGCCVLTDGYKWKSEQECEFLSKSQSIAMNFKKDIATESQCIALGKIKEGGVCVWNGKCEFTNNPADCVLNQHGTFIKNICSNEELEQEYNYDYEPRHHKGCIDGKEDVYYFDSHNNKEGVAEDCIAGKETCSVSEEGTDYECVNTGCIDENFKARYGRNPLHGESWCIYDSEIDQGRDTVGSEHWQASCFNGKINEGYPYKLCGSQRTGICVETEIESEDGSKFFITGNYEPNEANKCINYNQEYKDDELKSQCEKNAHCMLKTLNTGSQKINLCTPRYPKGALLNDGIDDNLCGTASIKLATVYLKKNRVDDWDCESNCYIEKPKFFKSMNDFCMCLGDCGTNINYAGKGTKNFDYIRQRGYRLDGDGNEKNGEEGRDYEESGYSGCDTGKAGNNADCKLPIWQDYIKNARVAADSVVKPNNHGQLLQKISFVFGGVVIHGFDAISEKDFKKIQKYIGQISGATGTVVTAGSITGLWSTSTWAGVPFAAETTVATTIGTIGWAATGVSIGMLVGSYLAKWTGVSGPGATAASLAGGFSGGAVAIAGADVFALPFTSLAATIFWIGVAIIVIVILLGGRTYETRYIEFSCDSWTPPTKNYDCEFCNADPMKPCTEYRCQSLGTMCKFLKDDSASPPCVKIKAETNPPIITRKDSLTGCITPGHVVNLKFSTNEFARCKWSTSRPEVPQFDKMNGNLFDQRTQWSKEHTISYVAPKIDTLNDQDITGNIPNRVGKQKIYIKCQDGQDPPNFNFDPYIVDLCINENDTEQIIYEYIKMSPKKNAYLPVGTTETEINMFIPEPGDCKYETTPNINYELMANDFSCSRKKTSFGYKCKTNLTGLIGGENTFYIKCKDLAGNINDQDFEYNIHVSEKELEIESISFIYNNGKNVQKISSGEEFKTNKDFISVEMNVLTSKGIDNGKSKCYWSINQEDEKNVMTPYYEYSENHFQILEPRFEGTYTNYIKCIDKAGSSVEGSGVFTIKVDSKGPTVIRIFNSESKLDLITNELAECYYNDANRCYPFNLSIDRKMESGLSFQHRIDSKSSQIYFIKCIDAWGNENSNCIKIKPV